MEDENKFWIKVWCIVAGFASIVVISVLSYNAHYDSKVAVLIKAGKDPMTIKCAMSTSREDTPTCIILATKEGNK
jgi:hypothetical protein